MSITQDEVAAAIKAAGWTRATARSTSQPPNVVAVHQGLEVRVIRIERDYVRLYGHDLVTHKDITHEDVVPDGDADNWEAAAITMLLQNTQRRPAVAEGASS